MFQMGGCEYVSLVKNDVDYHQASTHRGTQATCHECGGIFRSEQSLKSHVSQQHGKNKPEKIPKKPHGDPCPSCERKCITGTVEAHLKICEVANKKSLIPCGRCDKTFATMTLLSRHVRMIHEGSTPLKETNAASEWVCDHCPVYYNTRPRLRNHRFKVHGIIEEGQEILKCDVS